MISEEKQEKGIWSEVCKFSRFPKEGGVKEVALLTDNKGNYYLKALESSKEGTKSNVVIKLTNAELAYLGAKALGLAMR